MTARWCAVSRGRNRESSGGFLSRSWPSVFSRGRGILAPTGRDRNVAPTVECLLWRRADPFAQARPGRQLLAHGGHDRVERLRVVAQKILGGLAALSDLLAVERQPRA